MLIIEQQQLSLITVQSQVLWRKEGDDKTTIDISRDKIIGPKRAALRRIKWSLSAYFSLVQQENFSLYINMLGNLRQRLKIIFGLESVPCIFRKKTRRRPSRMELYIVSFSPWTLKIWLVILFCGCYTFIFIMH